MDQPVVKTTAGAVRPRYDTDRRPTMLFDVACRVADDPDAEERLAWDGHLGGI